jgi:methylenetetrahydromethanopterin dehydrogenase
MVKIAVVKLGFIGCAPVFECLLDERSVRKDITVRVFSPGSKMNDEAPKIVEEAVKMAPDFIVLITPNAAMPGPKSARDALAKSGLPTLIISDGATKKIQEELDAQGFGYIIVMADSMIGARREFLDPVEMALFNSDVIRVLAVTGVYRLIYTEIDKVIEQVKRGQKISLPRIIVDKEMAVSYGDFSNPYAKAKAMASYEMAREVNSLTTKACYVIKERERYLPMVAAAHEMMRKAAILADEAREIEKSSDTVARKPHLPDGSVLKKIKLLEELG